MRLALIAALFAAVAAAAERMPVAQQNALVQKYCAVCHTDALQNGGLSLEHFDAAQAPPSLVAMMLSKLTGGVALKTAAAAPSDATAAALIDRKAKSGAMGAAGIPRPDHATIDTLIHAFTLESAGATDWTINRTPAPTASILQEATSARGVGEAESYRLIASCNAATGEGRLQLAWSPVAQLGILAASVDGNAALQYQVDGAAAVLVGLPWPAKSLTISGLFPREAVTFSFASLPDEASQQLHACFPTAGVRSDAR